MSDVVKAKVVVLGSGPGGYTAAFRAADLLGEGVVLVEQYESIGGVCLNVGCIPSKALLHTAEVIKSARGMSDHGVDFGKPKIDINKIRKHKDDTIGKLTGGLKQLAKQRKVTIVQGFGKFTGPNSMLIEGKKSTTIEFENAIIAVGSHIIKLPFIPEDSRILDSTNALELSSVPKELLVLGGGIIGMEMAEVYSALGSNITVVELTSGLLAGADKDVSKTFEKHVTKEYKQIMLDTKVINVEAKKDGIWVTFEGKGAPDKPVKFDAVLCAVGRAPNGKKIDAEKAGVKVDERGFITSDNMMRTNVSNIYSIGDVKGNPMLAHKAVPEGKVAAEVIAGKKHKFAPKCIPSVAYTNPEVAWVGVTEKEAKEQGLNFEKAVFPWMASGRALAIDRPEGMTKILFDKSNNRVLGASIVGPHAGDLISEVGLAIEMDCEAEDLSLTIHPHPTLSETIAMAAEIYEGNITDLYMPKKTK